MGPIRIQIVNELGRKSKGIERLQMSKAMKIEYVKAFPIVLVFLSY